MGDTSRSITGLRSRPSSWIELAAYIAPIATVAVIAGFHFLRSHSKRLAHLDTSAAAHDASPDCGVSVRPRIRPQARKHDAVSDSIERLSAFPVLASSLESTFRGETAMPLTADDRRFLKSLRIQADEDIKDPARFGRCHNCRLPLAPFDGLCINKCPPKKKPAKHN